MSDDNVIQIAGRAAPSDQQPSNDMLLGQMEVMASNIAMLIEIATQMDKRVRALELSMRKIERRNVPVIVNQDGRPVQSKG